MGGTIGVGTPHTLQAPSRHFKTFSRLTVDAPSHPIGMCLYCEGWIWIAKFGWRLGGWVAGWGIIVPLRCSILQAETCQILLVGVNHGEWSLDYNFWFSCLICTICRLVDGLLWWKYSINQSILLWIINHDLSRIRKVFCKIEYKDQVFYITNVKI